MSIIMYTTPVNMSTVHLDKTCPPNSRLSFLHDLSMAFGFQHAQDPLKGSFLQSIHLRFLQNVLNVAVYTLQGINISHLGKRKIIFKMPFLEDMLVPWRVISKHFYGRTFGETLAESLRVQTLLCTTTSVHWDHRHCQASPIWRMLTTSFFNTHAASLSHASLPFLTPESFKILRSRFCCPGSFPTNQNQLKTMFPWKISSMQDTSISTWKFRTPYSPQVTVNPHNITLTHVRLQVSWATSEGTTAPLRPLAHLKGLDSWKKSGEPPEMYETLERNGENYLPVSTGSRILSINCVS